MYSTGNGDVNLNVGMNTEPAKKNALQLAKEIVNTFKQTDSQINKTSSSMMSLENRIQKTSDKLQALRDKQTELAQTKTPTEQYQALSNTLAALEKQLDKLGEKSIKLQNGPQTTKTQAQLDAIEQQADKLQTSITYTEEAMQRLNAEGKAFTLGGDPAEYSRVTQQIAYTENELDVLNTKHDEMISKQNDEVSIAERLAAGFNKLRGVVQKGVVGAFNKLKKIAHNSLNNVNKQTKKGIWTLMKYGLGIRSLYVLFRKLRSWASEAFKSMGKQIPEVRQQLNTLKTAFTGFKSSIGTAFQPLLAAALPVLKTIINYATAAANAIGSLFAVLTNQNYVYKATAANNDYADSVSGVGKAAKEANKQLGEYDELMVIQQDNQSGGGGGAAGGSGVTWEKVDVDDKITDLANKIKKAWKDADFTEIGATIGQKVKDQLDNIKWDKLQTSAEKAGTSLATFLNGFLQSGILESNGNAIGQALNTAISFGLGFVNNFEWEKNGQAFGKGFNKLVDTIETKELGTLIYKEILGALDFAISFFKETDFQKLGNKIGEMIKEIKVDKITIKVLELAWEIAKDAVGFVAGLNEASPMLVDIMAMLGFAKLVALGFMSPAVAITLLVAKISWDIGNAIYESLDTDENGDNIIDKFVEKSGLGDLAVDISDILDFETDAETSGGDMITGFTTGVLNGLMAIDDWLGEKVDKYIVQPWKELLGISDKGPSGGGGANPKTDGESFIDKFKTGILNAVNNIGTWIDTNVITPIQNAFAPIKELTVTAKGVIDNTFTTVKQAWENIKATTKTLLAEAKATGEKALETLHTAWTSLTDSVKKVGLVGTAKATGASAINKLKKSWDKLLKSKAVQTLEAKFKDSFTAPLKKVWNTLARGVNGAIDVINKMPGVNIQGRVPTLKLAKGAVIPPNKEFMAILGDQKQGTNIETPLQTMIEAFNTALDKRGGDSSSNRESIVLQLDGKTVAKVVWDENEKRYKQTGKYSPAY